ncbi:MAG: response regulator, partial [Candidatus Riflebacteria bacterium]|nr:response regulator [Candidatus Riflebacteria bacterium]
MSEEILSTLLVEDDEADACLLMETVLGPPAQSHVVHVRRLSDAVDAAGRQRFDVVLLDLSLPDTRGLGTVVRARAAMPALPIIVLTGNHDEQTGLEALRVGAQDYLVKGSIPRERMLRAIRYAVERDQIQRLLRLANEDLERKVIERTAELTLTVEALQNEVRSHRKAREELAARAAQLRALAGQLTLTEQRERQRLARLLHEHLQQLLVGAKFRVAILGRSEDSAVQAAACEIGHLLDESIRASRVMTAELSPPIVHEGGLTAGLEWLARWMKDRHDLVVELTTDDHVPSVAEDVRVLLFESVRELLFNAVKHARVGRARVELRAIEGNLVELSVADDGPGFEPSSARPASATGG